MDFKEQDLESIIYDAMQTPDGRQLLSDRGLYVYNVIKSARQFKIGNYGTCDLITLSRPIYYSGINGYVDDEYIIITIYELKLNKINVDSLLQGVRYVNGVYRWLQKRKNSELLAKIKIQLVLIGSKADTQGDFVFLFKYLDALDGSDSIFLPISIYTYEYSLSGICFDGIIMSDYNLKEEGF